jgi:signal transduction histidine kinase
MGIQKDKINGIFDKFSHVEDSLSRTHEGAGLGLIITKKLVELNGGKIWLRSKENKGTTIYVTFPK